MYQVYQKRFSWDLYSWLIIISYLLLQTLRWPLLPQFMDIYYHFLIAQGFIQANGYTGWDFWQYAPFGRIHIYPPFFHMILAMLMKLGINKVILAKIFESLTPTLFLIALWHFIRRIYNERLAFFVMLAFTSSFSFHLSLLNHIPATLTFCLGFLAFEQLFRQNPLRCLLLLTLCFYTHIGISWFLALSLLFYGLFDKQYRKKCFLILIAAFILSLPILFKQLSGMRFVKNLGLSLNEKYLLQIKIIDYVFAFLGLLIIFKQAQRYRLFLSFFLASLIFIIYPYRLFSAEGYFPIICLSAIFMYSLYEKVNRTYPIILVALFILFLSPTFSMNRALGEKKITYKLNLADSSLIGMLFAKGESIWYPRDYLSAARLVKDNSQEHDIVYSTLNIIGMTLSAIAERPTANALLPEIGPSKEFDPYSVAKIVVFTKIDDPQRVNAIVSFYKLVNIGENKLFILYKNPSNYVKVNPGKALIPFWAITIIGVIFIFLFTLKKSI